MPVQGDQVLLRDFTDADVPAVEGWASDPETVRFLPASIQESHAPADMVAFVRQVVETAAHTPWTKFELAVVARGSA